MGVCVSAASEVLNITEVVSSPSWVCGVIEKLLETHLTQLVMRGCPRVGIKPCKYRSSADGAVAAKHANMSAIILEQSLLDRVRSSTDLQTYQWLENVVAYKGKGV